MKKVFRSLFLSITQNTFAALACSSNGTMVYYVNGVLTSLKANGLDTGKIQKSFLKETELDEKGNLFLKVFTTPLLAS